MATAKRKRPGKSSKRSAGPGPDEGAAGSRGKARGDGRDRARGEAPAAFERIGDEFAAAVREVMEELKAWWR
jgi:hypothetical protein